MRFELISEANGIAHRLKKPNHVRTYGQVERVKRMNRTINDATAKQYHTASRVRPRSHLHDSQDAHNYVRCLKTISCLTAYENICRTRTSNPAKHLALQIPRRSARRSISSYYKHCVASATERACVVQGEVVDSLEGGLACFVGGVLLFLDQQNGHITCAATNCSSARSFTRCAKLRSSSKSGENTTTPNDPTVH